MVACNIHKTPHNTHSLLANTSHVSLEISCQAMKRCTALRPNSLRASNQHLGQRWHSYDKASLTKEALLQKVEAGLGHDADGKSLKLNPETKTVSTAAGDLPISPIFDPAWMQARRKTAKSAPGPPLGRFRRKLANNPFGTASF